MSSLLETSFDDCIEISKRGCAVMNFYYYKCGLHFRIYRTGTESYSLQLPGTDKNNLN